MKKWTSAIFPSNQLSFHSCPYQLMATPVTQDKTLKSSFTHYFLSYSAFSLSGNLNGSPFNLNPESGHFSPFLCCHSAFSHHRISPPPPPITRALDSRITTLFLQVSPHLPLPSSMQNIAARVVAWIPSYCSLPVALISLRIKLKVYCGLQELKCSVFCPLSDLSPYHFSPCFLCFSHTGLLVYESYQFSAFVLTVLSAWVTLPSVVHMAQVIFSVMPIMTFVHEEAPAT